MPVYCRSANGTGHPHSYGPALEQGRLSKDMLSMINAPRCKELPEDGRKQMETFEGQPWPPAERLHCRGEIRVYVNVAHVYGNWKVPSFKLVYTVQLAAFEGFTETLVFPTARAALTPAA